MKRNITKYFSKDTKSYNVSVIIFMTRVDYRVTCTIKSIIIRACMHPKNTSSESINNYVNLRKPRRLSMCIFKRNLNISFIINKLLVIVEIIDAKFD